MRPLMNLAVLVLGLLLTIPIRAQTNDSISPATFSVVASDNPDEGIHVSGDWTLLIHDSKGNLVGEHTFQNALTDTGMTLLTELVAGTSLVGWWVINLEGPDGPCLDLSGNSIRCRLQEVDPSSAAWYDDAGFDVLEVSTTPDNELALRGTFTPNNTSSASITTVSTGVTSCNPTDSVENCYTQGATSPQSDLVGFTQKTLDTPLTVEVGQVVTVEVIIGFN